MHKSIRKGAVRFYDFSKIMHETKEYDTDHEIDRAKKTEWLKSETIMKEIYESGMQSYIEKHVPHIQDALESAFRKYIVTCVDERVVCQRGIVNENECILPSPGSLLLLPEDEALEIVHHGQVGGITTHEGCGACAVYAKREALDETNTDLYGIERAKRLRDAVTATGRTFTYRHINADEMRRPKEFHTARVIYYIGEDTLNPSALPEKEFEALSVGFGVSARFFRSQTSKDSLNLCISIALGKHGFGDYFIEEEPLIIVPIAPNEILLDSMKEECEEAIRALDPKDHKRIKIDGFYSV